MKMLSTNTFAAPSNDISHDEDVYDVLAVEHDGADEDSDRGLVQQEGSACRPYRRRAAQWEELSPHLSSVRPPASLAAEAHSTYAPPPPTSQPPISRKPSSPLMLERKARAEVAG